MRKHNIDMSAIDPFKALLALTEAASARLLEVETERKSANKNDKKKERGEAIVGRISTPDLEGVLEASPALSKKITKKKRGQANDVECVSASSLKCPNINRSKQNAGGGALFAVKLMELLEHEKFEDIIRFLPDGKHFAIINIKKFRVEVMPVYFGVRGYGSFSQKLLRWGFECLRERLPGVRCAIDIFYHPLFERDNWKSCREIKCLGPLAMRPVRNDPLPAVVLANGERSLLTMDTGLESSLRSKTMTDKSNLQSESPSMKGDLACQTTNLRKAVPLSPGVPPSLVNSGQSWLHESEYWGRVERQQRGDEWGSAAFFFRQQHEARMQRAATLNFSTAMVAEIARRGLPVCKTDEEMMS